MRKPKRRWTWTPKNLRKTKSKDQRYNDISKIFKGAGGKGSWRVNRRHLKRMDDVMSNYAILESHFESTPFYGDMWLKVLPKESEHNVIRNEEKRGVSWYEYAYRTRDEYDMTPFPKEVYEYDFSGYLGDVPNLQKTYEAMDLGLKKHPKSWNRWDHPYW